MDIHTQQECTIDGCHNRQSLQRTNKDGTKTYRRLCDTHHRMKYNMPLNGLGRGWKYRCKQLPCEECGWDKSRCDIHRIVRGKDGGKYNAGNVIVLCPNCHRLRHPKY